MNGLQLFDVSGADIRFGMTESGKPYAVASDFAKAMGYRDAEKATRLLDEDEKGTQIVGTPGGPQRMSVIFEDGLWELIFRSSLPGAKAIKARVKEILREIRETGRYEVVRREPSKLELARDLVAALEAQEQLSAKVAELEPSARSWEILASANGDYSLRDAALILNRDPGIRTGQNLLMKELARLGMVDRWNIPYAKHKQHLVERPRTYTDRDTGEEKQAKPQVRITMLGLRYLHHKLGGTAPLRLDGPLELEAG